MIYVLNKNGTPIMPSTRHGRIRKLLKKGLAKVVSVKPFTVQLNYDTKNYTQKISLGIDSGYLNIGFSACTEKKELISGEVKLLKNMKQRIYDRSQYRKIRRQKLRYRKCRFLNRRIPNGWFAPSINHKLNSHINFINQIKKILPISKIIIEVGNFDIQKIKNPEINGVDYQNGEQKNFWNTREYILHRDNHKCQNPNCKNVDKNIILQIHHIIFKDNGGTDMPNNLITLCSKCHLSSNHRKGKFLFAWQTNKPKLNQFKDATFMNIVRWKLVNLTNSFSTFGYITKMNRIELKLEKTHFNDAFCIAKGSVQKRVEPIIYEQYRRNNRSLEKFYDSKFIDVRIEKKCGGKDLDCGRRRRNKNLNEENLKIFRGEKLSKGRRSIRKRRYFYQPGDIVNFNGKKLIVKGTQNNGAYVALKDTKKVAKVEHLKPYRFRKGISCL